MDEKQIKKDAKAHAGFVWGVKPVDKEELRNYHHCKLDYLDGANAYRAKIKERLNKLVNDWMGDPCKSFGIDAEQAFDYCINDIETLLDEMEN